MSYDLDSELRIKLSLEDKQQLKVIAAQNRTTMSSLARHLLLRSLDQYRIRTELTPEQLLKFQRRAKTITIELTQLKIEYRIGHNTPEIKEKIANCLKAIESLMSDLQRSLGS